MTKEEKSKLAIEIQKRLLKLEDHIIELKDLSKPIAPDCAIGRVSRMDAINNQSISQASLDKKLIQKNGLQAALENMYQDDFGKCMNCGAEIQMGRILIMPESRKCVHCS